MYIILLCTRYEPRISGRVRVRVVRQRGRDSSAGGRRNSPLFLAIFFWILAASALPGAGAPCAMCVTATATAIDNTNEANNFMTWRKFDRAFMPCRAQCGAFYSVCRQLCSVGGFDGAMTTQRWWRRRWWRWNNTKYDAADVIYKRDFLNCLGRDPSRIRQRVCCTVKNSQITIERLIDCAPTCDFLENQPKPVDEGEGRYRSRRPYRRWRVYIIFENAKTMETSTPRANEDHLISIIRL